MTLSTNLTLPQVRPRDPGAPRQKATKPGQNTTFPRQNETWTGQKATKQPSRPRSNVVFCRFFSVCAPRQVPNPRPALCRLRFPALFSPPEFPSGSPVRMQWPRGIAKGFSVAKTVQSFSCGCALFLTNFLAGAYTVADTIRHQEIEDRDAAIEWNLIRNATTM